MRERAARLLRQYGSDFRRLAETTDNGEIEKGDSKANNKCAEEEVSKEYDLPASHQLWPSIRFR